MPFTAFDPDWYPAVDGEDGTEMEAEQVNDAVVKINELISGFSEEVRDVVVAALVAGVHDGGSFAENDGADRIDFTLSAERVQDIVGAMFTGNTETNITATYQDSDGTIDLEVSTTTGPAGNDGADGEDGVTAVVIEPGAPLPDPLPPVGSLIFEKA